MMPTQSVPSSGLSAGTLKIASPGEQDRSRFGVRAKLQAAFGGVAALTVIATAVAFLSFSAVERGLQQIAGRQVPVMTDAMRLSVISADISAAAARFISARTTEDHKLISALIARKRDELVAMLERLSEAKGESPAFVKLAALSQRLKANLTALEEAISERNELRTQIDSLLEALHKQHSALVERLLQTAQFRPGDRGCGANPSACQPDKRGLHRSGTGSLQADAGSTQGGRASSQ